MTMIERGQIELDHGALAYAATGDGPVVVLLHQTPRSNDEYRDVLPALQSRGYRAIAFDTPGFGGSSALPGAPTIERWAQAMSTGLDRLNLHRVAVVGHHTGGVVAVELAAQKPERITALVLSSTPLTDAAYRATPPDESGVDAGEDAETIRASRAGFYPPDRPDLLDRYVTDALIAGSLRLRGHHVVGSYEMDARIARLTMPVLLIGADADPYAFPQLERMQAVLPHAVSVVIEGGMVPLPDGWPGPFAAAVADFLEPARAR
jgi:pimeloyl-ACP methyl ester carboxylesterase